MKIWNHWIEVDKAPRFKFKIKGDYLNRIAGVNFTEKNRVIDAQFVYEPLITIERHVGQTVVWLTGKTRYFVLMLMSRFPFIHMYLTPKEVAFDHEEEV